MKKLLSALLAATMVFSSVVMSVSAETATGLTSTSDVTILATDMTGGEVVSDGYKKCDGFDAVAESYISFTVDVAQAGTYYIIGEGYSAYSNHFAVWVANGGGEFEVQVDNLFSSWDAAYVTSTPARSINLTEGANTIQLRSKADGAYKQTSNAQIYSVRIKGIHTPPTGVTAAAVSTTTSTKIAYNDAAVKLTSKTISDATHSVTGSGMQTVSPVYVDAAEAGTYNIVWTIVDQWYSDRPGDVFVNGVKVASGLAGQVGDSYKEYERYSADVELREGFNEIYLYGDNGNRVWTAVTVTGSCYGLPTLDTVANEGKAKITWEAEAVGTAEGYTNASSSYTSEVNVLTAGDYYFTFYTQRNWSDENYKDTVEVNGEEVAAYTTWCIEGNNGYNKFKAVATKVTLNAGKNTIVVNTTTASRFDKFELGNYEVALPDNATGDGRYTSGNKYSTTGLETETVFASSPKLITKAKVYDTIPSGVSTIDFSGNYIEVPGGTGNRQVVVATYDAYGKLLSTKLATRPTGQCLAYEVTVEDIDLTGAASVKVMLLDDFTNMTHLETVTFTK